MYNPFFSALGIVMQECTMYDYTYAADYDKDAGLVPVHCCAGDTYTCTTHKDLRSISISISCSFNSTTVHPTRLHQFLTHKTRLNPFFAFGIDADV